MKERERRLTLFSSPIRRLSPNFRLRGSNSPGESSVVFNSGTTGSGGGGGTGGSSGWGIAIEILDANWTLIGRQ